MVPMEGVEPTHSYEYKILSLARLPIPPHRLTSVRDYIMGKIRAVNHCTLGGGAFEVCDRQFEPKRVVVPTGFGLR